MVVFIGAVFFGGAGTPVLAQWDPSSGQWGKENPTDVRVMTWNIHDTVCSTNAKQEGLNDWSAVAHIIAAMKPDVLLLQEAGDNSGNGTGSGVDTVANLQLTVHMLFEGGSDTFHGGVPITSYVRLYAPDCSLPYIFVSDRDDGYNRNVIVSRFPFLDLNGDTLSQRGDIPMVLPDGYAPGGNGGIRGFMVAEFDLPDGLYAGDLAVGCCHLKAGSGSDDLADRLRAAQNVAYVIDYWLNGAGTGIPDPNNKIVDSPPATSILDGNTPFLWGGDWNEDEQTNGRKGPAEWMTLAQQTGGTDGTDRDRTDSTYDSAVNPYNNNRSTYSSSKLDYLAWHDSIALLRRAFVFNSSGLPTQWFPPEVASFSMPSSASGMASDHRPVIADFVLPPGQGLYGDHNGDGDVDLLDYDAFQACLAGPGVGVAPACDWADADGDDDVDVADFAAFQSTFTGD